MERRTLINTFGGGVGGGNQAYSDEDFAKDTQLQLGIIQAARPRLAVIVCIPVCTPEHQYAPNQFKLGHLFTQSNVP